MQRCQIRRVNRTLKRSIQAGEEKVMARLNWRQRLIAIAIGAAAAALQAYAPGPKAAHAAASTVPAACAQAFRTALDDNPFLTVERGMFEGEALNMQRKVREDAAAYLGVAQDQIALTPNTTTGLTLVYHGLPLKPGDEVLVTTHDHIVHHESIRLSTERNGASVRKFALFDDAATASADGIVDRVRKAIRPTTRVLGVPWVHS